MGRYQHKHHPPRKCRICGEWFEGTSATNTLCSPRCKIARRREVFSEWYAQNSDYQIKRVSIARRKRRAMQSQEQPDGKHPK